MSPASKSLYGKSGDVATIGKGSLLVARALLFLIFKKSTPMVIPVGLIPSDEKKEVDKKKLAFTCLLYTSPSPRDRTRSRMPSSA